MTEKLHDAVPEPEVLEAIGDMLEAERTVGVPSPYPCKRCGSRIGCFTATSICPTCSNDY